MAEAFDHDRLKQFDINRVRTYGFWTWPVATGRRGGMVCFRGDCRRGTEGEQDIRVVDFWMAEFFRASEGFDGLVVDAWEFGGDWHDRLSFLPPVDLPTTFRVLYSVLPHQRQRAIELWGTSAVRHDLEVALAEMDQYLAKLPS